MESWKIISNFIAKDYIGPTAVTAITKEHLLATVLFVANFTMLLIGTLSVVASLVTCQREFSPPPCLSRYRACRRRLEAEQLESLSLALYRGIGVVKWQIN
jgi:hypothetical protein